MKMKTFDCVEMKRKGAEALCEQIKGMTQKELLEFWKKGTEELRKKIMDVRHEPGTENPVFQP